MTTDFSQYLNPTGGSSFDLSSLLGGGGGGGDFLSGLLGGGGFGGLFGGGGSSFKPYIDANGNYVWDQPKDSVPVPVSTIPGTSYKPSKSYRRTADSVKAITDLLPFYSRAVAGQIIPEEQAKLAAAQLTSPQYNQLSLDLLKQFGPQLARAGNEISDINAEASATRDKNVLQGAGGDLIKEALKQYQTIDPEFFATRGLTADKLKSLMDSIDLTGGLSGSERSEIERSLGQSNQRRGTASAPSSIDTVSNAMTYGKAGRDRQLQNQSAMSAAIAAATSFLPNSRVGFDPFQVATGKSSQPNSADNKFVGITSPGTGQAPTQASGIMGSNTQLQLQQMQINSQKKDWADYMNQVTKSISDVGSVAGGFI